MRNVCSAILVAFVLTSALLAQCPSQGLTLGFTGERLGDPFACGVFGIPGAPGLLGVDDTAGPTVTQYGTVCLGLTPNVQYITFSLDPLGQFWITGTLPAYPPMIGLTKHLQAAAVDPGQPQGLAISNSRQVVLRPPRLYCINPGYFSPFGSVPGSWVGFDALTDSAYTTVINLPSNVVDAVVAPNQGWLCILLGNGTVTCYDTTTALVAQTITVSAASSGGSKLAVDGNTLYVVHPGLPPSPFGGGTPGALSSYSLPSGAPGFVVNLPAGNPDAIMLFPGTGIAYLRTGTSITPVDVAGGNALTPVVLSTVSTSGGIGEWVLAGNILYCLFPGSDPGLFTAGVPPLLNAIDTSTHLPLFADAQTINVNNKATMLRYGPGSTGNVVFLYIPAYPQPLIEVNPVTLVPQGTIPVSTGLSEMALSPGGAEWLLLCTGAPCGVSQQLQTLVAPSMTVNNISPLLYPMQMMIPLPSATLRRAFMVHNYNTVVPFSTDFSGAPITAIPLPISNVTRIVVD
jgi:hypothetical protein